MVLISLPMLALALAPGQSPLQAARSERQAILNVIRVPLERRLGAPVELVVTTYRRKPHWAFVQAEPQRPGGRPINGRRYYGDDWTDMDGLTTTAIIRRTAGRWRLVELRVGATDAWYCGFVSRKSFDPCNDDERS